MRILSTQPDESSLIFSVQSCCFRLHVPVELRMLISTYIHLKTELSYLGQREAGHTHDVLSLILVESEKRLYSRSSDHTIKVWDIVTNFCVATLEGHNGGIRCLSVYPQSKRLFSGSLDKTIKVWNTETLQCVRTLEGHTHSVKSLIVDEHLNRLYSGSPSEHSVKVWDLNTGTCVITFEGGSNCFALCPISHRLYSGSADKTIKAWNTVSFECVATMSCNQIVTCLVLSADGSRLYVASRDKHITIWDTATSICIATLEGHTYWVTSLCLSLKTNRLISAAMDKSIRIWDTTTNTCICTVMGAHDSDITCLALSDQYDMFYSGSVDNFIKSWRLTYSL
jgi:WD40 repeat protein